jgi:hypothetical protein
MKLEWPIQFEYETGGFKNRLSENIEQQQNQIEKGYFSFANKELFSVDSTSNKTIKDLLDDENSQETLQLRFLIKGTNVTSGSPVSPYIFSSASTGTVIYNSCVLII